MPEPIPHYITTSRGQVRLFQTGAGPNLVAVAGMATAASVLCAQLAALCPGWRITVCEMPGVGGSANVEPASVDDCAAVLAEALSFLSDEPLVLLGSEFSCPLVKRLAGTMRKPPEAVFLAGAETARAWKQTRIAPPDLTPRPDGTHLQALWAFIRDRHILQPANPLQPATQGEPLPGDGELSETFVAAAVRPQSWVALWALCRDALPAEAGGGGRELARLADLADGLQGLSLPAATSRMPATAALPDRAIWHHYVETANGRIHLRRAGDRGTPLLVIPSGGGSCSQFAPVISGLADGRQVFAVDYPGNGLSHKPAGEPTIESLADDMLALLDALGIQTVDIWGSHTGSLVGLEMAVIAPHRVGRLVMEGPVFISPDFQADILANYFPPMKPDKWGLHLPLVWNWRRDVFLYWPWYRVDHAAARQLGVPTARELHKYAVGILESGNTYGGAYRAAFAYDTRARLPLLTRPCLICAGPNDMLKDGLAEAALLGPAGVVEVRETPTTVWWPDPDPAEAAQTMELYEKFLRG